MNTSEKQGLSPKAYETMDGNEYPSFVPPAESPAEFTGKAILTGILIGCVFGAANAYLGLKVGLTVSASIPAAVMAVAIFRLFFKGGSILETNMVQTIGSAGESLAAGVIFTIPALFIWEMEPSKLEITVIAITGGLMGVLFMIPLRNYLIVKEHGKLPYPEGTACAEVLVAGQGDLSKAKTLFTGMGIGALYQLLMHNRVFGLWNKEPATHIPHFTGAEIGAEITPELLGVGYIIGPRISAVMLSGGIFGWLVLIPLILLFGEQAANPISPEASKLISDMSAGAIWSRYIRYIGAGGVAFAGIFSLIKSIPVIIESFRAGFAQLGKSQAGTLRTQQDIPISQVLWGSAALIIVIGIFLVSDIFQGNPAAAFGAGILIVLFGFFFVTVSSRIVGLLGSSSNPISGMTIATLLLTCVLFILFGFDSLPNAKQAILIVGAFVCIAAAIAGDTSQDLKTGFLIGATPRRQQMGELIGVISAGLTMGFVMFLLKDSIVSGDLPAPQANLMRLVIDGVIGRNLPWNLVFCGIFIAFGVELLGVNSLAFAVGLYLPISLSVPIMVGGMVRAALEYRTSDPHLDEKRETGVLYSSGLIAGAALIGVLIMVLVGLAEKHPVLLEPINKPGIYLQSTTDQNWTVNGTPLQPAGHFPVRPAEFPDSSELVGKISQIKQEMRLARNTPDHTANLAALETQFRELSGKLQAIKIKSFALECRSGTKIATAAIELEKWQTTFLSLLPNGQIAAADLPEGADRRGVIAFAILTLSLAYFAMRKPTPQS
jgi:putative OPT family oligopeptide transporter